MSKKSAQFIKACQAILGLNLDTAIRVWYYAKYEKAQKRKSVAALIKSAKRYSQRLAEKEKD